MQIPRGQIEERGLPITMRHLRFFKFILEEIFPGGRLPTVPRVEKLAENAGFVDLVQPLQLHYARTLDLWAAALESRRDEAIAVQSEGSMTATCATSPAAPTCSATATPTSASSPCASRAGERVTASRPATCPGRAAPVSWAARRPVAPPPDRGRSVAVGACGRGSR